MDGTQHMLQPIDAAPEAHLHEHEAGNGSGGAGVTNAIGFALAFYGFGLVAWAMFRTWSGQ